MKLQSDLRTLLPDAKVHLPGDADLSDAEFAAYGLDRTARYKDQSHASAIVLPASTQDVARLVRFARENKIALVPSGGRTGLAGGAVVRNGEVVVALGRMNRELEFLPHQPALRVQAGMILSDLHAAARRRDLLFPVDYASAGSVQVGGMVATNAGGTRVIRYGNTRDQVLGLTCVTGAGDVLEFPGDILKNNSGYDLRQLVVGSEGTLAIITDVTLRLVAPPDNCEVVLCACATFAHVLTLLETIRNAGLPLLAFECFDANSLDAVREHLGLPAPFREAHGWYVVLEYEGDPTGFEALLERRLLPESTVADALRAESSAARRDFWMYREGISESLSSIYTVHKDDLSLPPARMPEFLDDLHELLKASGVRSAIFGHVGDGNLHVNLMAPFDLAPEDFFQRCRDLDTRIYTTVRELGGSISAEHGIGLVKREHLHFSRTPAEIELMRAIKSAFDPDGILNPGKLL